jgi:hypothetical protein
MAKRSNKKPLPKTPSPPVEESRKPSKFAFPTMQQEQADQGEEIMSWSVTPLKYDRRRGVILGLSTFAFVALVYFAYRDFFWPSMALILSVISFSSFIFPNHYKVTTTGLLYRNGAAVVFRPWTRITKFKEADDGVYLVTQKTVRTRILGPGVFLYYGEVDRTRLHEILTRYIPKAEPQIPESDAKE